MSHAFGHIWMCRHATKHSLFHLSQCQRTIFAILRQRSPEMMYICSIINVIYYYWSYEAKKICKIYLAKMSTCVILVARKEKISFYVQYKLSSHHSFTKLLRLNPVSCLRSYMCGPFCKWVKIGSNAINFFTKIQHVDLPPYWNAKIGPHNDVDGTVLKCLSNEKYSMYVRNNYRFFAIDVVLICAFCSSLHGSSPVQ